MQFFLKNTYQVFVCIIREKTEIICSSVKCQCIRFIFILIVYGAFNNFCSFFWTYREIFKRIYNNSFSSCSSIRRDKMRVFSIKFCISKSINCGICDIFFIQSIHNFPSRRSVLSTFCSVFLAFISTFTSTSSSSKSTVSTTYIKTTFFNHFAICNYHLSSICTISSRATASIPSVTIFSVSISSSSSSSTFSVYTIIENTSCIKMKSIHVCDCISSFSSVSFYIIGISSSSSFYNSKSSTSSVSFTSSICSSSSIVSVSSISSTSSV